MLRRVGLFAAGVAATTTAKLLDSDSVNAACQMIWSFNGPQWGCTLSGPRTEEEAEQRLNIAMGILIMIPIVFASVAIASSCSSRRP